MSNFNYNFRAFLVIINNLHFMLFFLGSSSIDCLS